MPDGDRRKPPGGSGLRDIMTRGTVPTQAPLATRS
ncbi:unnamed protein product [Ectocarpus sp. CCAP 1310/34]|nr:unnamed protein product [Ectocarpus sp. CCAP 1310/34]